ncbi:helix-turn-helix domain-containing protein [Agromyces mangrovi Wang et al. 2018]|uniref:hypothetical protein n=1 Tax=Agromyces mangrovi TaxID=1858653 RepID=UPI0025742EA5|nr:hypothetical protein [Agromyces mangrovi]BDZ64772.1 hypothetical protein GCM10025877_17100 [Agromyces mangrovi]
MLVSLTERGRALYERVGEVWGELDRITTAGLDEEERARLDQLLRKVLANLGSGGSGSAEC